MRRVLFHLKKRLETEHLRNLTEWSAAAALDSAEHLHAFNHQQYASGALAKTWDGSKLIDAYGRFDSFLATSAPAFTVSHHAIQKFSEQEIDSLAAGSRNWQDAAAYAGVQTKGVSSFAALKSFSFVKDNLASVGLPAVIVSDLVDAINRAFDDASYKVRPRDQFRVAAKRSIDQAIKLQLAGPAIPAGSVASTSSRTGAPVGMSVIRAASTGFPDTPMWLTTPEEIEIDRASTPPEIHEDVTVRSAYAAGLKEALGLFNSSETKSDRERMAEVPSHDPADPTPRFEKSEAFAFFGVVLLLRINHLSEEPVQPNIFSLGYENLFVSRPANSATSHVRMDGKTVRLKLKDCRNHGDICSCGTPGLPEAVIPANVAMTANVKCDFITPVFSDDLNFDLPDTEMIRKKNA